MENKSISEIELLGTFLKIGAVAFGGGYAMIPIIRYEVCDKKKWLDYSAFSDIVTIAQTIPGPVAINTVGIISYRLRGLAGLLAALSGVILPAFFVILVFSAFVYNFSDNETVGAAFVAVRAAVGALVFSVFLSLLKDIKKTFLSFLLVFTSFVLILFFDVEPAFVLLTAIFIGLVCYLVDKISGRNG
ncbi:chromate transporter [Spirochaetia bacterium 38H-sp]|uniref:Chromate transporter n=1 Tax=Rarispira pelagica TaxID=3141764 RepID=A0ABU9UDN3_9SPIR